MMAEDGLTLPSSIRGFVQEPNSNPNPNPSANPVKKKRNLPGTPDPEAEVIALSPKSLMATNRFICEICNKGFQRDQNLQLHRRGHNLPWKLRQRTSKEVRKKVYICPEKSCVHHNPTRALGDLTGIKKHYSRKHGEKKWKCEKCSKKYAVQSDWKAHSKICGTREYKCDCGTLFSRKDSFITHRAFCDALAEESARLTSVSAPNPIFRNELMNGSISNPQAHIIPQFSSVFRPEFVGSEQLVGHLNADGQKPSAHEYVWITGIITESVAPKVFRSVIYFIHIATGVKGGEENKGNLSESITSLFSSNQNQQESSAHMSATALLQKAAQMGSTKSNSAFFSTTGFGSINSSLSNTTPFSSYPHGRSNNQVHKFLIRQSNQSDSMNQLINSTSPSSTMGDGLLMGDMNSTPLVDTAKNNMDHFLMVPSNPKQAQQIAGKFHASSNEVERGLTRDFLGVGSDASRPFLQQELAKFASMGSAMGMSQYSGNH
ncbi:Protein indeterminate-domain 2 [Vitis vinifera]|uniref:Protein indeterminate-domain 2 n=1 Tax=Vitis vinifera TaxID=29760 RepID=A0A438DTI3_VITVI|nr:Protein indeterminate-domain 2 [Vitis vinifera]